MISEINFKKADEKPSSITLFLSKFISNGFDISMLLISNAFPRTLVVEKKNIFRDRNKKKYISFLSEIFYI